MQEQAVIQLARITQLSYGDHFFGVLIPLVSSKMGVSFLLLSVLVSIIVSCIFLPKILSSLGESIGYYLRRTSRTRRELLLARVASEQRSYPSGNIETRSAEDDDWEKIEGYAAGTAANGGKADQDWKGIVGFFHPFW